MTGSGFYTLEEAEERIAELQMEETDLKDSSVKPQSERKINDNIVKEVSTDLYANSLKNF